MYNSIINFKNKLFWILNKIIFKEFGYGSIILKPIYITPNFIKIKKNVFIHKNSRIEGIINWNDTKYSPLIEIHDQCSIQQNLHLTCANHIKISNKVAIGANVTITDINHLYTDIHKSIEENEIEIASVYIGENSKIYNNSVILPGTRIGKHCVIGANSVVSGIIPDYSVVVGAPSKIIKRYCFESNLWKLSDKNGNIN